MNSTVFVALRPYKGPGGEDIAIEHTGYYERELAEAAAKAAGASGIAEMEFVPPVHDPAKLHRFLDLINRLMARQPWEA